MDYWKSNQNQPSADYKGESQTDQITQPANDHRSHSQEDEII